MTALSPTDTLSSFEKIQSAVDQSSQKESKKSFSERLKEEAAVPFSL